MADILQQLITDDYLRQKAADEERQAKLQELISARSNVPVAVDLTPLATLADSMAGTKVSAGAGAPAKESQAFQAGTEDMLEQLYKAKGGGKTAGLLGALGNKEKQGSIDERFMKAQANSSYKDWMGRNQKELKAIQEFDKRATNLEDALASGNIERINGALATYARLVNEEKGVLTDADVSRVMIPTIETWSAKIKSMLGNKTSGQVPPEVTQNLIQGLSQARKENQAAALESVQSLSDTYLSPALGIAGNAGYNLKPFETAIQAAERLGKSRYADKLQTQQKTPTAPGGVVGAPPVDEQKKARLEELRARKAKGG